MKVNKRQVAIIVGAVACIGLLTCLQFANSRRESVQSSERDALSGRRMALSRENVGKQSSRVRIAEPRIVPERSERPNLLVFADEEERELTELAKEYLASLQAALDSNDFGQIQSILASVQDSPCGVLSKDADGLPVALRKRFAEAIGWFGVKGIPELTEFLGDEDPEVAELAMAQFELALEDITLGDRDRAEIVVLASKALHDVDALEQIFMEISNMRNSVAAQTLIDICYGGTDEAKSLMSETIEFVTGEEDIATIEELQRWLDENPDGPDDDDLYGPMSVD